MDVKYLILFINIIFGTFMAYMFRYEMVTANCPPIDKETVATSTSCDSDSYPVWDRWQQKMCLAFYGHDQIVCSIEEVRKH